MLPLLAVVLTLSLGALQRLRSLQVECGYHLVVKRFRFPLPPTAADGAGGFPLPPGFSRGLTYLHYQVWYIVHPRHFCLYTSYIVIPAPSKAPFFSHSQMATTSLRFWVGRCGDALPSYHRAAALPLIKDTQLLGDTLSPRRAARSLDVGSNFLALVLAEAAGTKELQCVGVAIFRPDGQCGPQLMLLACTRSRCGIARSLVALVRHVCSRHVAKLEGGSVQLHALAPRDMHASTRKFLRAVGFVGARDVPRGATVLSVWREGAQLAAFACPLTRPDCEAGAGSALAAMLGAACRRASDGEEERTSHLEGDAHGEPPAGDVIDNPSRARAWPDTPGVGTMVGLWVKLDRQHYPAVVREREVMIAPRGGRKGPTSCALRVSFLPDGAGAAPPQMEERAVEGWKLERIRPCQRHEHHSGPDAPSASVRSWYVLAAAPGGPDWQRLLTDAAVDYDETSAPADETAAHAPSVTEGARPEGGDEAAVGREAHQARRAAADAHEATSAPPMGAAGMACHSAAVDRGKRGAAAKREPLHPTGGQVLRLPTASDTRRTLRSLLEGGGDRVATADAPVDAPAGAPADAQAAAPPQPTQSSDGGSQPERSTKRPRPTPSEQSQRRGSIRTIPRPPFAVHSPPLPPTPESPARPDWWTTEDDERAAELLYTLFSGDTSANLERNVDEWVLRENAVAAEAFPHVPFWRGLDIRWLRWSLRRREVGEALRALKAAFARGEGRMRFIAVEADRSKRSRRGAAAAAEGGDAEHPLQVLLRE